MVPKFSPGGYVILLTISPLGDSSSTEEILLGVEGLVNSILKTTSRPVVGSIENMLEKVLIAEAPKCCWKSCRTPWNNVRQRAMVLSFAGTGSSVKTLSEAASA